MTNEQAIKHLEVIKGDCALVGDLRALDIAISALSTEGEYIKKSELMDHVCYCADWNMDFYYVDKDDIEKMQTYSFPDSADDNTTHWIDGDAICPKCGKNKFEGLDADIWADWKPMYCPNCGRKAVKI